MPAISRASLVPLDLYLELLDGSFSPVTRRRDTPRMRGTVIRHRLVGS